jgi:hypothetical protein
VEAEEVAAVAGASAAVPVAAELAERIEFLASLEQTTFYGVGPGSALALDCGPAELGRSSLVAATRHLTAIQGYAEPAFAALRDALEAAASVVWLLEPDDADERHRRLLAVEAEDARTAGELQAALGLPSTAPVNTVTTEPAERVAVAADYVAAFTASPATGPLVPATWRALGAIALGRGSAYEVDTAAMLAGSLALVLDVAETAASLWYRRAVPEAGTEG